MDTTLESYDDPVNLSGEQKQKLQQATEAFALTKATLTSIAGMDSDIARGDRDSLLDQTINLRHKVTVLEPLGGPQGRIASLRTAVSNTQHELQMAAALTSSRRLKPSKRR